MAFVMALATDRQTFQPGTLLFLTVGLCGGFTTMSTFSYETFALYRDGHVALAVTNVGATLVACLAAVWLGQAVTRAG